MSRHTTLFMSLLTAAVISFTPTGVFAGDCNDCLEAGECEWTGCGPFESECKDCEYTCPDDQTCTWNTCTGETECDA